jgi:alpha-aminoadipic semialdehyde synthase
VAGCQLGVDILPSELPREASKHFGDLLLPFIETLCASNPNVPFEQTTDLPAELKGAVIAQNGRLAPKYAYIAPMHLERKRSLALAQAATESHARLLIQGHLFDTNLINQVLDLVEGNRLGFNVKDCLVRPNKDPRISARSSMVLEVMAETPAEIAAIVQKLRTLITLVPKAEATLDDITDADERPTEKLPNLETQ